jgi:hypothetical protein
MYPVCTRYAAPARVAGVPPRLRRISRSGCWQEAHWLGTTSGERNQDERPDRTAAGAGNRRAGELFGFGFDFGFGFGSRRHALRAARFTRRRAPRHPLHATRRRALHAARSAPRYPLYPLYPPPPLPRSPPRPHCHIRYHGPVLPTCAIPPATLAIPLSDCTFLHAIPTPHCTLRNDKLRQNTINTISPSASHLID